jgi:MFS family permease
LASPKLYLALYAFIGVLQGMTFSYLSVVLSTIEKRFGLQSKEAAWIYSGNEISQIFFIVFLPFVGRVKRRPLFISMGIMLSAIGSIVIAMPNFTGDQSYLLERAATSHSAGANGKNSGDVCFVNETRIDHCINKQGGVKDYASLAVVFVGIFIIGKRSCHFLLAGNYNYHSICCRHRSIDVLFVRRSLC